MAVSEEFSSSGIWRRVHWFIGNEVSEFTAHIFKVVCLDKNAQATQTFMHCLPIVSWTDERPTLSTTNHRRHSVAVYKLVTTNFMEQNASSHADSSSDGQKKFPAFYGTRRPNKIPPLYTNPVKRHPTSLKSFLILPSILRLRTWRWPRRALHVIRHEFHKFNLYSRTVWYNK